MIGLLAALLLSTTTPADPLGARIAESAQAAQALQGPLDGAWVLRDAKGRRLLILQIVDPAGGGPLAAAWREPGDGGATGYVDAIERTAGGLMIRVTSAENGKVAIIRLNRSGMEFAGRRIEDGRSLAVRLTRAP